MWSEFTKAYLGSPAMTEGARSGKQNDMARRVRRAMALVSEGAPAKALQALTSHGIHDRMDESVRSKLMDLHLKALAPSIDALP